MSIFKIRPWPFNKNEVVELYWLCSPYMNKNRQWILRAVLKTGNNTKVVEVPWGTLPYLRLGQRYKDGCVFNEYKKGFTGELNIKNEEFHICSSFDMPSKLYYFYKNVEYGLQKVCTFKIGEITYFIPCIELVRSFFAKSKTLTNYILKPNGLDFLISNSKIINDCLYIYLSIDVPEKIATKETAAHLGWIKYNSDAFESWCSVYGNIYDNEVINNRLIELLPPIKGNCTWQYRGIKVDNNVLILELLQFSNIRTPFRYVKFSHPRIKRTKVTEVVDKFRNSKNGKGTEFEMTQDKDGQGTRMEQHQKEIEIPPTRFLFEDIKNIEKITEAEREVFIGTKIITKGNGKNGNDKATMKVSTEDWTGEGKIAPIEFKSLEIVKGQKGKGLEDFYKVIRYIRDNYKEYDIAMTEVFLPEGRSFSYYPDGDRRNCAVIKIMLGNNKFPIYLIEIGRIDHWPISTIILKSISINHIITEENIIKLLEDLIANSGHWNVSSIRENHICCKIKHIRNEYFINKCYKIMNNIIT